MGGGRLGSRGASLAFAGIAALAFSRLSAQTPDSAAAADSARRAHSTAWVTIPGGWLQARPSLGANVSVIDGRDPMVTAAGTLGEALASRIPGVSVTRESGAAGARSSIRLRGATSTLSFDAPLVFIDGILVHSDDLSRGFLVSAPASSRLDDVDLHDIDRIEVLRGPAAAALYGAGAAHGVIHIRTRRHEDASPRYRAFAEGGFAAEATTFPANFLALGVPASGSDPACRIERQAQGDCTFQSLLSSNPLNDASPFRRAPRGTVGGSVARTSGSTSYRLAASHSREGGATAGNDWRRTRVGASIAAPAGENMDVSLSVSHVAINLGSRGWDATTLLGAGLLSPADAPTPDGFDPLLREQAEATLAEQDVDHTSAMANVSVRTVPWLTITSTLGWDRVRRVDGQTEPLFGGSPPVRQPGEAAVRATGDIGTITAGVGGRNMRALGANLSLTTSGGIEYRRERADEAGRLDIPGGSEEVAIDLRTSLVGVHLQEQLAWREQVYLGAGVRRDAVIADIIDFDPVYAMSVQAAWLAHRTLAPRGSPSLTSLRLRGAYGRAFDHRMFSDPQVFRDILSLLPVVPIGNSVGGISPLEPERITEFEAGFDIAIREELLAAEVTYFRATTGNAFATVVLPPSGGISGTVAQNAARVRSSGVEALLRARMIDRPTLGWDLSVAGTWLQTRVDDLPPVPSAGMPGGPALVEGEPVGALVLRAYSFADANNDGLIAASEIIPGELETHGAPMPTTELAVRSDARLPGGITVSAVLDRRAGHRRRDDVGVLRCAGAGNCREVNDPTSELVDQARAAALRQGFLPSGFVDDARFARLRELSIGLQLPRSIAGGLGSTDARLRITASNLATWTDYRGLDPETDSFALPLPRIFTARLDMAW